MHIAPIEGRRVPAAEQLVDQRDSAKRRSPRADERDDLARV
jgi:hypothetical protein